MTHVVSEIECIDRMYLNCYVPKLQYTNGLIGFLRSQLGMTVGSTAPFAAITNRFNRAVERFAAVNSIPVIQLKKGERKDDIMHEHLARFQGTEGILFIGWAQEKVNLFRTETRHDAQGGTYPCIVPATGVVKQWYFYCVDEDFGPFFLKFCSYFPYNARLCINVHQRASLGSAAGGQGRAGPRGARQRLRADGGRRRGAGDLRQLRRVPHGQTSYDLRRLAKHDLIRRKHGTHRYQVTDSGAHHALFLTRVQHQVFNTGLAELAQPGTRLHTAIGAFDKALGKLASDANISR